MTTTGIEPMSLRSPTKPTNQGFMPLSDQNSYNTNMQSENDIQLTLVRTNSSSTARNFNNNAFPKDSTTQSAFQDNEKSGLAGRRKLKGINSKPQRVDSNGEEEAVTGMGKVYSKIVNFSVVTRYFVYVFPIGALLAVPIAIGATSAHDTQVAGVRLFFLFLWLEIVWLSIWVSKLVAKAIPGVFIFLCGVVSSGTRKYALVIKSLEIPISLVGWAATVLATFNALVNIQGNDWDRQDYNSWPNVTKRILPAIMIAAAIYLAEKLVVQLISISYHQRSFNLRIKESKRNVHLIGLLYEASRTLFSMYCAEFEDEDLLINDSIESMLANRGMVKSHHQSGSTTPMRLIGDIGRFGDKVTSAFGNIASEIAGKEVFNPTSVHSVVVEALEKKRSSEALARRIWMSFVVEGKGALYLDDIEEVLGPARREEAQEAFTVIDNDGNGDISIDEMIMKVVEIGRERKSITNSMKDIGQAISVLDQVLSFVVLVIVVFVFIAFLNTSFVTTLAAAGAGLLSLSFVFAVTAQEFLGSCIFLFVKHPYDVGDRVDITGPEKECLVVEQISLLYTVFRRVDCMKTVQVPNIVLNNLWIENVSRSKAMKEQLEMFISFDTTLEDIETLRKEVEAFVRHPDNSRDFQPDIILECTGIGNMDKLQLKVEIRHKSNWANETVRAARRSKFMCALVLALRKVPIYCPGGGGLPLGDPRNPAYSVAVSDQVAAASREEAAKTKEAKRLIPNETTSGKRSGADVSGGSLGIDTEVEASDALNARRPTDDGDTTALASRDQSLERTRSNEIKNLRQNLLKRENTRGRRRPGETAPPMPNASGEPGLTATQPSPRMRHSFDEEANMGLNCSPPGINNDGSYLATGSTGASYSMFPLSLSAAGQSLQPPMSAMPQATRSRGLSVGQRKS